MEWQPIETAPNDVIHVRGMWVHSAHTGLPIYWTADAGYPDDEGDFIYTCGEPTGWRSDDYTHWMPLPDPPKD